MDVSALSGGSQGMGAASNAQKMNQASEQEVDKAQPAVADNAQQEAHKPQIPGVGESVDITV